VSAQLVGDILAPWFSRGDLPEVISLMDPAPRAGLQRGDTLTWSDEQRAYVTPRGDFCVLAAYVRSNWLTEFAPAAEVPT